jgi:Tol biopolymer transport system component
MRKTRLLITIVIVLIIITGLHDRSGHADHLDITVIMHPLNTYLDPAKITVLTHTPNDDLDPVWSPDGEQIAFVGHHEGNPEVYVLDVSSGDLTNVSNSPLDDYEPLWSPDGQYLTFGRRDDHSLHRMVVRDMITGTEVESSDMEVYPADYYSRVWSPDSQYLIFEAYSAGRSCARSYRVQSASYQRLVCNLFDSSFNELSPDGHWLVIEDDSIGFQLSDLESGNRQSLDITDEAFWSPDSQALAYVGSDRLSINIHNIVSSQISSIYSTPQTYLRLIGWSSTGHLAWRSSFEDSTKFYVMEPVTQVIQMVADFDLSPGRMLWSPAGRFIGFNVQERIYVLDTVTATLYNPINVRDGINDLLWSSDGQYLSIFWEEGEIVLIHVGTWTVSRIRGYSDWTGPNFDWSPDGTRLVFSCGSAWATNLCLVEMP